MLVLPYECIRGRLKTLVPRVGEQVNKLKSIHKILCTRVRVLLCTGAYDALCENYSRGIDEERLGYFWILLCQLIYNNFNTLNSLGHGSTFWSVSF